MSGDVAAAGYAAARSGAGVIMRTDRSFIRVHGRDPVKMVQGLVTNDIAGAAPDRVVYAAVLTPKGKMVADVRVLRRNGELLLDVAAAAAEPMSAHLRKFVPPLYARFEDATEAWRMIGVYGARAARVVAAVFADVAGERDSADVARHEDAAHETSFDDAPVTIMTTSYADVPGFDLLVPAASAGALQERLQEAGAAPLDGAALETLRIEAGTPRWGAELDDTTIPLEAGLRARAISETKGCYTGQEVIIRILHRGHVNWLLRGVLLGDAPPPARGAVLVRAGETKQVGRITSATYSPQHAQTIALAYVRREVEPGTTLQLDGAAATVVELPFRRAQHGIPQP